jgi:TonB family protein
VAFCAGTAFRHLNAVAALANPPGDAVRERDTLSARGVLMRNFATVLVCRGVVAALLLGTGCSALAAQESQLDTLAKQCATALVQAHKHDVVVLDFYGTDAMNPLGEKLAVDFRDALARDAAGAFKVEDRDATIERVTEKGLKLSHLRDSNTMRWIYGSTSVDSWITGTMSDESSGLKLAVQVHHLGNVALIAEYSAVIPLLPDLKALIQPVPRDEFASLPANGAEGYSKAACVSCPSAVYSTEAIHSKMTGTVVLSFTIDKHGRTKDIRVKQALPDGLTQQAVDAVRAWKFSPAKNSKGKKVEVRQQTEIGFYLG